MVHSAIQPIRDTLVPACTFDQWAKFDQWPQDLEAACQLYRASNLEIVENPVVASEPTPAGISTALSNSNTVAGAASVPPPPPGSDSPISPVIATLQNDGSPKPSPPKAPLDDKTFSPPEAHPRPDAIVINIDSDEERPDIDEKAQTKRRATLAHDNHGQDEQVTAPVVGVDGDIGAEGGTVDEDIDDLDTDTPAASKYVPLAHYSFLTNLTSFHFTGSVVVLRLPRQRLVLRARRFERPTTSFRSIIQLRLLDLSP